MRRRRAAHLMVWGTAGAVVLLSFGLILAVARQDYQINSYAELFRLENLPAIVIGTIALAVPALLVTALPLALIVHRVRRPERWREQGRCTACGYLLSDAACCSECGKPERA